MLWSRSESWTTRENTAPGAHDPEQDEWTDKGIFYFRNGTISHVVRSFQSKSYKVRNQCCFWRYTKTMIRLLLVLTEALVDMYPALPRGLKKKQAMFFVSGSILRLIQRSRQSTMMALGVCLCVRESVWEFCTRDTTPDVRKGVCDTEQLSSPSPGASIHSAFWSSRDAGYRECESSAKTSEFGWRGPARRNTSADVSDDAESRWTFVSPLHAPPPPLPPSVIISAIVPVIQIQISACMWQRVTAEQNCILKRAENW